MKTINNSNIKNEVENFEGKRKLIVNIFRFFPSIVLLFYSVQVIILAIAGIKFPIPFGADLNIEAFSSMFSLGGVFCYMFLMLMLAGFILFFLYPLINIILIIKDKKNRKEHLLSFVIFYIPYGIYFLLEHLTGYMNWYID